MQAHANRLIIALILATGSVLLAGCKCMNCPCCGSKEAAVTMAELSAPARATVERETAGGRVEKITREVERGKTVYDVEATVNGRHMEYVIDAADGKVLGTEVPIEFSQLPEPVRAAAEKYFGTTSGLTVMKGVEYGETHYEIEGKRNGKTVEMSFDPTGKKTE